MSEGIIGYGPVFTEKVGRETDRTRNCSNACSRCGLSRTLSDRVNMANEGIERWLASITGCVISEGDNVEGGNRSKLVAK